ncbi:DUF6370 family protein [Fimbriiglobus ruber]|uniref:Uncharacterized protein n=1 Tax=Fimbriiglobus ruber TaxID=1908690 RepID=A0A225DAC6_9BACT|nr:DUF6370 family protein [Fimbriiglobus ruber]OWK36614.1 hypothetical protein FRUB_09177 [Fimbriiglobus ruber]
MMKKILALVVGVTALAFAAGAFAEDKKPETKTLEGKLVCTKCELKETPKCGHCLLVKDGDKEVKYYISDKGGAEKYHGKVCQEPKDAKVTGKIGEKDGKKTISDAKVEIKE